jgi:surfeit locus 1 family protein
MRDWVSRQLLGLHLLAVAAITICALMGLWQLGVYGAKHDDHATRQARAKPADLLSVWGPDDPFTADLVNRRVRVDGRFDRRNVFRVARPDGQEWLAATVPVQGTKSALVIVLGRDPKAEKPVTLPSRATFIAVLQPSEASGDLSMAQRVNDATGDLFSGYGLLDDPSIAPGLTPVKPPEPHVSWTVGLRNLAYALQWWVFGLFSGFMWWRMATDLVALRRTPTDDLVP